MRTFAYASLIVALGLATCLFVLPGDEVVAADSIDFRTLPDPVTEITCAIHDENSGHSMMVANDEALFISTFAYDHSAPARILMYEPDGSGPSGTISTVLEYDRPCDRYPRYEFLGVFNDVIIVTDTDGHVFISETGNEWLDLGEEFTLPFSSSNFVTYITEFQGDLFFGTSAGKIYAPTEDDMGFNLVHTLSSGAYISGLGVWGGMIYGVSLTSGWPEHDALFFKSTTGRVDDWTEVPLSVFSTYLCGSTEEYISLFFIDTAHWFSSTVRHTSDGEEFSVVSESDTDYKVYYDAFVWDGIEYVFADGWEYTSRVIVNTASGSNMYKPAARLLSCEILNGYLYVLTVPNSEHPGYKSHDLVAVPLEKTRPSAPADVEAVAGDQWFKISWSPPKNDGNSEITGYKIFMIEGTEYTEIYDGDSLSVNFTKNVVNGRTYTITVCAINAMGEGERSTPVQVTPGVTQLYAPSEPRDLRVVHGDGYAHLSWSAPDSDGGAPIVSYRIHRGDSVGSVAFFKSVDGTVRSYNDTTVENGRTYFYHLSAKNSVGEGSSTDVVTASPEGPSYGTPTSPRDLRADPGDGYVRLEWQEPASDGGFESVFYRVYRGSTSEEMQLIKNGLEVLFFNDTDVNMDVTYYYQVRAWNVRGEGPGSEIISATPTEPVNGQDPIDGVVVFDGLDPSGTITFELLDLHGLSAYFSINAEIFIEKESLDVFSGPNEVAPGESVEVFIRVAPSRASLTLPLGSYGNPEVDFTTPIGSLSVPIVDLLLASGDLEIHGSLRAMIFVQGPCSTYTTEMSWSSGGTESFQLSISNDAHDGDEVQVAARFHYITSLAVSITDIFGGRTPIYEQDLGTIKGDPDVGSEFVVKEKGILYSFGDLLGFPICLVVMMIAVPVAGYAGVKVIRYGNRRREEKASAGHDGQVQDPPPPSPGAGMVNWTPPVTQVPYGPQRSQPPGPAYTGGPIRLPHGGDAQAKAVAPRPPDAGPGALDGTMAPETEPPAARAPRLAPDTGEEELEGTMESPTGPEGRGAARAPTTGDGGMIPSSGPMMSRKTEKGGAWDVEEVEGSIHEEAIDDQGPTPEHPGPVVHERPLAEDPGRRIPNFCPYCGEGFGENDSFCSGCGRPR